MAFRRQTLGLFSSSEDSGTSVSVSSSSACTAPATTSTRTTATNYKITDSGNSTMKVVVRVRPENETEIRSNYQPVVKMLDEHVLVFDPSPDNEPSFRATSELGKRRPALGKKHKDLRFAFDHVFDETASQTDVFQHTTESIVDGVLDGINCSVFAYGATGAGKTYTMLGNLENPGVMFLTMMELYRRIDELKDDKICEVAVSYCEVYNETIRDLLVPSAPLDLREDGQKGLVVAGLSRHTPKTANEILSMLEIGNRNRTQHPTDANATSSRSHAVFQVFVHQKARTAGLSAQVTRAKMSLIDLAGSERATVTTNRGARLREGANINKSLLALGNCINALAENKGKAVHVPYRNSKLTRLLKDSLGGNCRTVMIANVSPSGLSYEDTYNTLKYADRAKQIKTKLVRNVVSVDFHVTKYKTIVIELTKEVAELKAKLDKKASLPNRHSYDPAEASRLQGLVKAVYSERCRLRKQMAELDTSEREALLKVSRKERDIQRIDTLSANDAKKSKISSRIEHLRHHVDEVQNQKEALNERLCANNEAIGRVQAEINTACGDSNKPGTQALRHLMEVVVEAKKLEVENAHQWRMTKLLLKFIKNQEREITKTEKLLVFSLQLVQRQHTMLRASQTLTPNLQETYDTLVRLAEGEKGVAWADQSNVSSDGLMDVSTSNFTQSQHALFDNLLVSASPRSRMSDVGVGVGSGSGMGSVGNLNSPFPISTSLGILTASNSNSVRTASHTQNGGNSVNTPLSTSVVAGSSVTANNTPRLHQFSVAKSGSGLYQRRQELTTTTTTSSGSVNEEREEDLPPISNSAFRSSPFVHRTTVSASGVKCETSINGVRAVTIASSNGPSNLLNQLSNSGNNVQIASSAGTSTGTGGRNDEMTPVRVPKTENSIQSARQKLPQSHLDDMDSVLDARFHSNFKDLGSDSSQGSTSMYSTQCVVTNRHMHVSNCAHTPHTRGGGVSLSTRKNSGLLSNPGSPRREINHVLHDQPLRPKSANEVLQPQSCRFTAFTPVRTPGRSNAKLSDPQTPSSFSSNSIRGGANSSSHEGVPMASPGGRKLFDQQQNVTSSTSISKGAANMRLDSGYSMSHSKVLQNGNGINGEVPSPYLVPRSRTESKNMTDFHSSTSTTTAGCVQPAFSVPAPPMTNPSNNNSHGGYSGYVSFSSQVNPGSVSQLPGVRPHSPSQQSQSLSISSDSSTNCVVDMNLSSKPRPAFQTVLNNKTSNLQQSSLPSSSGSSSHGLLSTPQTQSGSISVRTAVLPTRNFCSFEDNFVSPRSFSGMGRVPKTPTGVTTSTSIATTPLSSNLSRSGPLHRQFPPSVSSRSNYFSAASSHEGFNKMRSPAAPNSSMNNYSSNPSSSNNLSNPYSANVCSNLHRGARSAPHLNTTTGRFQSGIVPPQSPGVMANHKTYIPGAPPSSSVVQYQMQSLPAHESHSGDSMPDSTDHIYQSIEAPPPPLPPPRSRNIYVPRPQGSTSGGGGSSKVQSSPDDVLRDPGYASRLIRPYTAGSIDTGTYKKSSSGQVPHMSANTCNLNETFTIEPSRPHDDHEPTTLPSYQRHKIIRPNTAPDREPPTAGGSGSNFGGGSDSMLGLGGKSSNPYIQHPRHHHHHHSSGSSHNSHINGVDRKLPSYLQMTKSAASKRVPREQKLSSGNGVPPSSSSSTHHSHSSSSSKAQDKENKGRTLTNRTHHSTKSSLMSSSSKWNRRHPSTSSNGSSSAFVKPVMRVNHHGNSHTPLNAGGGLLRSREPTTASA